MTEAPLAPPVVLGRRRGARLLVLGVLAVLLVNCLFSVWRMVAITWEPTGGYDFYPYWYAGIFLRQGQDPYGAYLRGATPSLPVTFIDGAVAAELSEWGVTEPSGAGTGRISAPAQTAPFVLAGMGLASLSWPSAKWAWFGGNLLLIGVVLGLLPWVAPSPPAWRGRALVAVGLAFVGALATRVAVSSGQTALLVLALTLGALVLLDRGAPVRAGVLTGLALSKYSLAPPLVLYLVYRRQWRALGVALLVQAVALLVVAWIGATSPLEVFAAYAGLLLVHTEQRDIELRTLLPPHPAATVAVAVLLTAPVFAWLGREVLADRGGRLRSGPGRLALLSALAMWTLLVAYHGPYDAVFALLPLGLLAHEVARRPRAGRRDPLLVLLGASVIVLNLPGVTAWGLLPGWAAAGSALTTLTLLALLLVSLRLVRVVRMREDPS
jgi:hypothetical protein